MVEEVSVAPEVTAVEVGVVEVEAGVVEVDMAFSKCRHICLDCRTSRFDA